MYGRTTTYKFEKIKEKATVKAKCANCGKTRQRTLEASQTLNPFNKNKKTGEIKTYEEIVNENKIKLKAMLHEFHSTIFVCCERKP